MRPAATCASGASARPEISARAARAKSSLSEVFERQRIRLRPRQVNVSIGQQPLFGLWPAGSRTCQEPLRVIQARIANDIVLMLERYRLEQRRAIAPLEPAHRPQNNDRCGKRQASATRIFLRAVSCSQFRYAGRHGNVALNQFASLRIRMNYIARFACGVSFVRDCRLRRPSAAATGCSQDTEISPVDRGNPIVNLRAQ
jgi:hypothetical protein